MLNLATIPLTMAIWVKSWSMFRFVCSRLSLHVDHHDLGPFVTSYLPLKPRIISPWPSLQRAVIDWSLDLYWSRDKMAESFARKTCTFPVHVFTSWPNHDHCFQLPPPSRLSAVKFNSPDFPLSMFVVFPVQVFIYLARIRTPGRGNRSQWHALCSRSGVEEGQ